MENYNKQLIEEALLKLKKRKVKSFYSELFAKRIGTDIDVAEKYLNRFINESNILKLKYEVRCLDCLDLIKEYNESNIELGRVLECECCNNETIVGLDYLYKKYHFAQNT